MSNPRFKALMGCAVLTALVGCSTLENAVGDRRPDYRGARTTPTLEIPPDLTGPEMDETYTVPARDVPASAVDAARRAPAVGTGAVAASGVLPSYEGMQLRREGDVRWIEFTDATPEQLWPKLRDFWRTQEIEILRDDPAVGVMETEWVENRAGIPVDGIRRVIGRVFDRLYDAGTRDKFRLRVERENGRTNVYLVHRGAEEMIEGETVARWVMRPSDPELEAEMLSRLLVFLGRSEGEAESMLAASGDSAVTAEIVESDGRPALRVNQPLNQSWRRVGVALDRASLAVDEQRRDDGVYFVTYHGEYQAQSGLMGRLFGVGGRLREDARYQIHLIERGDVTEIVVYTHGGDAPPAGEARLVLERLKTELR